MPALVAGIHVFQVASKTWMAGTSPAMTSDRSSQAEKARGAPLWIGSRDAATRGSRSIDVDVAGADHRRPALHLRLDHRLEFGRRGAERLHELHLHLLADGRVAQGFGGL